MSTATYRPIAPITHQRDIFPQPITALYFDPVSDTLWAGTNAGSAVAYYTPRGMRGVTFRVGGNLAVRNILADESFVFASGLDSKGVGAWSKGGVNKWHYRSPLSITATSNTLSSSKALAVATSTPDLLLLNATTGSVIRQASVPSVISQLHFTHSFLLSGSSDGFVRCFDSRTGMRREGGAESSVKAHPSEVQGLQSNGNNIYTIGWGLRQARAIPDPLVKVYDIRTMRPLPPVPFPSGPAFINVLPKRSSTIVITSNQGLVNIVDTSNPNGATEFYQLDMPSVVRSTAVSQTGAYMAFGDSDGAIHLMTAADDEGTYPFNGFEGQPIEWADTPEPLPDIDWDDSTPLNRVGLPHYTTQLLSSWTPQLEPRGVVSMPPSKIPEEISRGLKRNENVWYAALPRELRGQRNVVKSAPRKDQARFRSGKSRSSVDEDASNLESAGDDVPRKYAKVEIEYSKFGVEDFDFGFYNKTEFSGLETHILNSYTNPLLQVMHYLHPIRRLAKSHITTNCPREHCLLCELGFVVRMLEDARGTNCQSTNFCKTVNVLAHSLNAIELIDYGRDSINMDHSHMIQSFHRFLIDHLAAEGNNYPNNPVLIHPSSSSPLDHEKLREPVPAPVTQLLGLNGKNIIMCTSCQAIREKDNMTHVVDMIYPHKGEPGSGNSFRSILQASIARQLHHKAPCASCRQFASLESMRSIASRNLPPILAFNTNVQSEELMDIWMDNRKQTFLKPRVKLHGQVNGVDDPESVEYELKSLVVKVVSRDRHSHLVAIVKVPEAEGKPHFTSPWFVFNDFVVHNISEQEALSFSGKWKVPTIIYLERINAKDAMDFSKLPDAIDTSILSSDTSISLNRDPMMIKHEVLREDELPKPGTLVAIDAEFVEMQSEETEYRSDGSKKVLRPARLSLARVSVLRGDGPKQAVPFIDDHIHTSEAIVNYLTEFSGIRPGDLDPHHSRFTLAPLKLVYKKLRLLVDRGCIFIGHGLPKDFRIINIFVPPEQVIDTVDLYFLSSRQRRLSLRFLSWFVLGEKIQLETHDSIEDARCALMLYKAYNDFEEQGVFDEKLDELYREGRKYNWKPPPPAGTAVVPAAPSPVPHPVGPMNPFVMMQGGLLQSAFVPGGYQPPPQPAATPGSMPNFFGQSPQPQFGRGSQRNSWR